MLAQIRCRVGLHRWKRVRNPEGGWYRECGTCKKQAEARGSGGSTGAPAGM